MIEYLNSKGIELRLLPVVSAPELSICDNSLFKDFKIDLNKEIRKLVSYSNFANEKKENNN